MHADETALLKQKHTFLGTCDNFKIVEIGLIHKKTLIHDLVCCLTNKAPHTCETIASRARCTLFKMSSPLAFQT